VLFLMIIQPGLVNYKAILHGKFIEITAYLQENFCPFRPHLYLIITIIRKEIMKPVASGTKVYQFQQNGTLPPLMHIPVKVATHPGRKLTTNFFQTFLCFIFLPGAVFIRNSQYNLVLQRNFLLTPKMIVSYIALLEVVQELTEKS
jgi:hypothetical protein